MGFSDLTAHVFSFCSFSTRADQFSCCAKIVSFIFFAAVFIATLAWHPGGGMGEGGHGAHLFTGLVINGTETLPIPFPQITICPLWPMGSISNVRCYSGDHKVRNSSHVMQGKIVLAGRFKEHPAWNCTTFDQPLTADYGMWCDVNSTNTGNFTDGGAQITWPGRVIVFATQQGELPNHCEDCFDGVTMAMVQANTTGFLMWGAHVFEGHTKTIEYRMTHTSMQKPQVLASVETSDMDFALGFYTRDVMTYRIGDHILAQVSGERFGAGCAFVGGLFVLSYLIFACLRTTLVLMFLGKDAMAERTPII